MGSYAEAKPLCERALAIREKQLGPEHPEVAVNLDSLALLLWNMGSYTQAKPLLERALAISEKQLGPGHPEVAGILNDLALLLWNMGSYAEAKPLYERALAISEKQLGPHHPHVALSLNNLALLLQAMGSYAEAKPLFERALAIREKQLGSEHPDVAQSLNNLAWLFQFMGSYTEAKPLHERALAIRERQLGPDHPEVAASLASLARVLLEMGETQQALEAALRAEAIGAEHLRLMARGLAEEQSLRYASVRPVGVGLELSIVADHQQQLPGAARRVWDALIDSRALVLDETASRHRRVWDISRLAHNLASSTERLANLMVRGPGQQTPEAYRGMLEKARREKESAEQSLAQASEGGRQEPGRGGSRLAEVARALPYQAALVAFVRYGAPPRAASQGKGSGRTVEMKPPTGKPTRSAKRNEASEAPQAPSSPKAGSSSGAAISPVASYLALVLPSNLAEPTVVPLGPAQEIEALVRRWKEEVEPRALAAGHMPDGSEAEYRAAGGALRRKVWDPVAERTLGAKQVFVVPDGALNLVNFAALPTGYEGYLVESGPLIHYASAERDLIPSRSPAHRGEGLLTLGGPAYDESSVFAALSPKAEEPKQATVASPAIVASAHSDAPQAGSPPQAVGTTSAGSSPPVAGPQATGAAPSVSTTALVVGESPDRAEQKPAEIASLPTFRSARSACGDFHSMRFEPLPGAAREAEEVIGIWKTRQEGATGGTTAGTSAAEASHENPAASKAIDLSGAAASEAAFKAMAPGRRIVHLATHGFFLTGKCESALDSSRGLGGLAGSDEKQAPPPLKGENPLLLSGLALAGANHRSAAGPDEEDGILTAEEIAAMDLSGVEWAVLSACDTGVGEIKASEGVFGLRRAFQVAGAGTLIMSLWSVDDEAARAWMKALYQGRLLKHLGTAEAVREASLSVLRARRAAHESTHPFYWAGFVAAGDWR